MNALRIRRADLRDYRGIAAPVSTVVLGLAGMLAITGLAGYFLDPPSSTHLGGPAALVLSSLVTAIGGVFLLVVGQKHETPSLTRRDATVAVVAIWVSTCLAGALPFWLGARMTFVDSLFESVSGLTTTGATVIAHIEEQPRSLLLWRSIIQWLGGMGIVVLFVAVFPNVGVGGKHMVRGEVPGTSAKGLKPRIRQTAFTLWRLYLLFSLVVLVTYWALGMSPYDAVCHALTTISTGGFSTHTASIAWFESRPIEVAASVFMLAASVNYGLYYASLVRRSPKPFWNDAELRVFLALCLFFFAALFVALLNHGSSRPGASFVNALFTVATTISSTGYGIDDPSLFPGPALHVVLVMMLVGGCAGSTAGGIKIERIVLGAKHAWRQMELFTRPRVVRVLRLGDSPIDDDLLHNVTAFLIIYFGTLVTATFAFSVLDGIPVPAAVGAALTCLSNMGPAPFHVGADNFVAYSSASKMVAVIAMLLGRLEFFTLLAIISRDTWKR